MDPSTALTRRLRPLRTAAATVAAAALLAACGAASADPASSSKVVPVPATIPAGVTIRVADQLNAVETVLRAAGQDRGFPYTVQYSNFVGGPPMLQAFRAGSVDLGYVADSPLIFAQAAHQPITALAAWSPANGSDALVTAPGQAIHGWADLKGKKVAYQQGTVEEAVVLEGLHSVGLALKDITTVNLSTTSITPALDNGSVAAGILVQPLTSAYLSKHPTATQVLVGDDITEKATFLIGSTSVLADPAKVAVVNDYVGRLRRAYLWINTHRAEWAQTLYVSQYKVPLALGEKVLAAQGPYSFLSLPGALVKPQQDLADLYTAAGEIPSRLDVTSEFNGTFNAAATSGSTS